MSHRRALAIAAGVIAFAVLTTGVGMAHGAPPQFLIADLAMGLVFVLCGLTAVWLRPISPAGAGCWPSFSTLTEPTPRNPQSQRSTCGSPAIPSAASTAAS